MSKYIVRFIVFKKVIVGALIDKQAKVQKVEVHFCFDVQLLLKFISQMQNETQPRLLHASGIS